MYNKENKNKLKLLIKEVIWVFLPFFVQDVAHQYKTKSKKLLRTYIV